MKSGVIFVVSSFLLLPSSVTLKSSPIQSDFLEVGWAFCAHLRSNDVDRQNVPLLEPRHDFYFFRRLD